MTWQNPNYEVNVTLWEGEPGSCAPRGADEVDHFRTLHVPQVGDLVAAGDGIWRVLAVQWTAITHVDSANYRDGQRGGMVDLAVERAQGIFAP